MDDRIAKIIELSVKKSKAQQKEYKFFSDIMVYIKEPIVSDEVDVSEFLRNIEERVPFYVFEDIDWIFIGPFSEINDRDLEAIYKDGAIYISNTLMTNQDYIENIIHEAAHSLESKYGMFLFGDRKIENEFLGKRKRLYYILKSENFDVTIEEFMEIDYSEEFDRFLYEDIGYPLLENIINGIFVSPYAVTSLKEYYANGLEKYFMNAEDRNYLKYIRPQLYYKLEEFINGYQD